MPVNLVHEMGWTRKSAQVTVLLAMAEHRKQVGARVLQLRSQRCWTHEDLAHAAGVSVKTVSRTEKGTHEIRRATIRKLAEALDVTEQDLIGAPPKPAPMPDDQLDRIERKLDALVSFFTGADEAERQEAVRALRNLAAAADAAAPGAETPAEPPAERRSQGRAG